MIALGLFAAAAFVLFAGWTTARYCRRLRAAGVR
jgi:hypothetical protein